MAPEWSFLYVLRYYVVGVVLYIAWSLGGHCHYHGAESKLPALCTACQDNVKPIIIYCRALNDLVLGSLAWILVIRLVSNSVDIVYKRQSIAALCNILMLKEIL